MNSFMRTSLLAGLATGAAVFILALVLYALGLNPLGQHKFMFVAVYAAGMAGGMMYFRRFYNEGQLSAAQGMGMGILVSLTAATLYATLLYLWLSFVSDGMLDVYRQSMVQLLEINKDVFSKEMGKAGYEAAKQVPLRMTAKSITADEWLSKIIWGFPLAILSGLAMRK